MAYRLPVDIVEFAHPDKPSTIWEINVDGVFVEIRLLKDDAALDSVIVFGQDRLSFSAHTSGPNTIKVCFSDGVNFADLTLAQADLDRLMLHVFPGLMRSDT